MNLLHRVSIVVAFSSATFVNASPDNIMDYSLEELLKLKVTTASKVEENIKTAPGDIVVVTRKQIQERGYLNLEDILRDLPSVDVQPHSASTSYNNISIRGIFGNSKFVILQDGVRISSPTGEDIPVSFNFPLYHVKQVEFIYGASSALYGADALSGVINLITLDDTDLPENQLTMRYGEDNFKYASHLSSWKTESNYRFLIGVHHQSTNGPELDKAYPEVYQLEDLVTLGGQTVVLAEDREGPQFPQMSYSLFTKFTAPNGYESGINRSVFKHTTATGTRPNTVDYGKSPFWRTEIDNLYLKKQWQHTSSITSFTRFDYSAYHIDEDSKFSNIFVDYGEGYKYAEGKRVALTQQLNWNISANQSLILGFSYQDFESIPKTADLPKPFDEDRPINQQDIYYPFVGELPVKFFKIDWNNKALFVQHQAKISDGLNLTTGIRYDDSSNYGETVNPRVGLVYETASKSVFKVLYGEAFIAPTPRFTHDHFGSFAFQRNDGLYQSFFMQIPNTSLAPEESKTLELNYQRSFSEKFAFQASLYQTEVSNLIDRKITEQPISDFIPGGFINETQIYDNVGAIDLVGGDFRLNYQSESETASISWQASYSFNSGDFERLGNVIDTPYAAPNKFKFNLTYRTANWRLTPSFYWYDETPNNAGDLTDDYSLLNLFVEYQVSETPIRINASISNLLDECYFVAAEANLGVLESVPQQKRHISLGLSYQF